MTSASEELRPGEEILLRFRPLWRSFWVFFLGILICGVGPFVADNPPLSPGVGVLAAVVFALIIARRWSNVYTLTNRRFLVRGGLAARETYGIDLAHLRNVEVHQGLTTRLVGTGHLMLSSNLADQENILVYGQPHHELLRERIEQTAAEARGGRVPVEEA
jgi:hypothetical protein